MLRSALVVLAIAGSAIVLSAAPHQNPRTDTAIDGTVAVGVACGDRTFVPLAARTKGRWAALIEADERVSLQYFFGVLTPPARRLPRQGWTLYPRGAGAPRPLVLRSRGTDSDPGQCLYTQAFDSNAPPLPGRVACPGCTQLLPQIGGIGVLGPARFESGDDVTAQPDEDSRRVASLIVREVHVAERRLDRETGEASPLRLFTGRKEVRSVVRLLSMIRHRIGDDEWYFFQAQKRHGEWFVFEGKRMYKEWAVVLLHGWVRSSSTGIAALPADASFVDDGLKTSRFYRLTGVLVIDERIVWITEGFGFESQWVELFEAAPARQRPHSVLTVDTGGS